MTKKKDSKMSNITKLEISVRDRLIAPKFIPKEGSMIDMVLAKSFLKLLEFTADEIEEFELTDEGDGNITWNANKSKTKEISINKRQVELLLKILNNFSDEVERDVIPDFFVSLFNTEIE